MVVNVHEAKTHLSRLLLSVTSGEEVIIARAGKKIARLVPCAPPTTKRVPGRGRGKGSVADDFDAPLPDEVLKGFYS
ncbi:MAG: antitoxin [Lentisphaerae bacterium RIFOXYB12_FULL_65_16]|nr:MAG: antitoxin [Lentisphaerae bacterium RIFOXYA12_64_32]OGV87248.1 MAG: antitoxin [Lentisphaerae bacterium RIFOXYB12_FULL_65_16]